MDSWGEMYDAKIELAAKLEEFRDLEDNMKTKDYHQSKSECSQCGKTFHGKGNADTCGTACRVAKSRAK